jgi:hypothetical protein
MCCGLHCTQGTCGRYWDGHHLCPVRVFWAVPAPVKSLQLLQRRPGRLGTFILRPMHTFQTPTVVCTKVGAPKFLFPPTLEILFP